MSYYIAFGFVFPSIFALGFLPLGITWWGAKEEPLLDGDKCCESVPAGKCLGLEILREMSVQRRVLRKEC